MAFAVPGKETRRDLMRGLRADGPSGLAAGDIALRLGVSPSTLSFHLRAAEQAWLVAATRGRGLIQALQLRRRRAPMRFLADARCDAGPARCRGMAPCAAPPGRLRRRLPGWRRREDRHDQDTVPRWLMRR